MLKIDEAIKAWKDFETRANGKRSTQIRNIKEDRAFLSGDQWDNDDLAVIDGTRPNKRTVNVLGNSVNSTVNVYASYPYKFYSPNEDIDQTCEWFLKTGSNARAAYDALYSNVAFGLGYMAIGSEQVMNQETGEPEDVPALYNIDKIENVYFDPDSSEIDGHDAMEAAIVEYRSKEWVKAKYGEEWATPKGVRAVVNTTDNKSPDTMAIVTYYRMNKNQCEVYRLLNNDFIDEPITLNIDRIPVFPVYGERFWDGDTVVWQGIVRKGRSIQKLINYAFTQLCERLAMAPKNVFITEPEAIEGYVDGYRNFNKNNNPILLYNRWSPDHKIEYNAPIKSDNRVAFDDITNIIGSNLDLLSSITGIDSKGILLGEAPQKTATEVLSSERQTQCTIRHYYANLRDSFKAVGECVMQLLGKGKVILDVIQGPEDSMQLQIARQELMTLMGVVPEQQRMAMVQGIFLTHPDNAVMRNVFGSISQATMPNQATEQAMQTCELMKQKIDQLNQQNQELQEQVKRYELYQDNNDKSIQADFLKMKIQHEFDKEDQILKAQLDGSLNAEKAAAETQKAQIGLEKEALSLEAQKARTAQAMMGGMNV